MDALHSCNNGGHVVFKEGVKYTIGTALDLTFLNHIDIGMKLSALVKVKYQLTWIFRHPVIHPIHQ